MARKLGSRTSAQVSQAGRINMSSPSRRSFGVPDASGLLRDGEISDARERRLSPRTSWIRPNILSRLMNQDEELVKSTTSERPPIPSALPAREPDSTPLPVLSMIVLSIVSVSLARIYHGPHRLVDYARRVFGCKRIDAVSTLHGQRHDFIGMISCGFSEVDRCRVQRVSSGIRYCLLYRHSRSAHTNLHHWSCAHLVRPVAAFFLTQFLTSLLWVCTDRF